MFSKWKKWMLINQINFLFLTCKSRTFKIRLPYKHFKSFFLFLLTWRWMDVPNFSKLIFRASPRSTCSRNALGDLWISVHTFSMAFRSHARRIRFLARRGMHLVACSAESVREAMEHRDASWREYSRGGTCLASKGKDNGKGAVESGVPSLDKLRCLTDKK